MATNVSFGMDVFFLSGLQGQTNRFRPSIYHKNYLLHKREKLPCCSVFVAYSLGSKMQDNIHEFAVAVMRCTHTWLTHTHIAGSRGPCT